MSAARLAEMLQAKLGARQGMVRSVGTLVGGTALAQALSAFALPILTRLYTPAEFSILAVYASILSILTVVSCLRLEIAIPLPERDEDAVNLLVMAFGSGIIASSLIGFAVLLFGPEIASLLRIPGFEPFLWLVPFGVFVGSAYNAIQYWETRKKRFLIIAKTRMVQALGGAGVQAGTGLVALGPLGLLVGHLFSAGAGLISLARDARSHDLGAFRGVSLISMRQMLGRYSRFPKYSTLEALANTVGSQAPIIIIAALALGPEAGYLMLASRLMAMPMSLVGGSIAQVYLAHAPDELRANRLGALTGKMLVGLIRTGVGPLLFAGIVAGPFASLIFGDNWERTGDLISWMTPWFVLQFIASPVSMVMHITDRQSQMLAVTFTGLIIRLGAMVLAYAFAKTAFSEIYAVSGALFYGVCCLVFYRSAGVSAGQVFHSLSGSALPLMSWIVAGFASRLAFEWLI